MKKQFIITMAMAASGLHGGPVHAVSNIIQPDIVETTLTPATVIAELTHDFLVNQLDSNICTHQDNMDTIIGGRKMFMVY